MTDDPLEQKSIDDANITPDSDNDEIEPDFADSTHEESSSTSQDPMETNEMLHVDRYEGAWMRITAIVIAIFFMAVIVSAFAVGFQLPGVYERVDPKTLFDEGSPFADPGLRELAPGKYELYIRAQIWDFFPNEIHVPVGSEVTFFITSADVQHGIKLQDTNINMMILPGQISKLTHKFDKAGEYQFVCHEYCGQLHHTMYGTLYVDEPTQETADEMAVEDAGNEAIANDETTADSEGETD